MRTCTVFFLYHSVATPHVKEPKTGKNIQSHNRIRLLPKSVETLLFLKYDLHVATLIQHSEKPPNDFEAPNTKEYDSEEQQLEAPSSDKFKGF